MLERPRYRGCGVEREMADINGKIYLHVYIRWLEIIESRPLSSNVVGTMCSKFFVCVGRENRCDYV